MTENRNKTFRKQDTRAENQLAQFMDKYFYSKLSTNYRRVTDQETQLMGVDIVLGMDSVNVDEKASLYYDTIMLEF